jgi:hypothetical protein
MLSEGACKVNEWRVTVEGGYGEWQDVDRELRSIARRQSGLDAELMRVLREAERVRLWRYLGCVSMMEYLERVFGYSPRVAQERIRTARKLEQLPELADALEKHELSFSAVRELSRIVTPVTQATWRAATVGKSLREIEEMVSGLAEGDLPTSRKKPELMLSRLTYEVPPSTRARERQLRQLLDAERGERLDDAAFIAAVFEIAIDALARAGSEPNVGNDNASDAEASAVAGQQSSVCATGVANRAKFQVVVYQCKSCGAGKQLGGGVPFDLDAADMERAHCDAEHVSALEPGPVTQDVPAKVRRFVELRDGKRCRIPGCRSTLCLDLHHIKHREDGGSHEPDNIVTICGGHHDAHHRDRLWIGGTGTNQWVRRADEGLNAHVGAADGDSRQGVTEGDRRMQPPEEEVPKPEGRPDQQSEQRPKATASLSRFDQVENRANACSALVTLGWKKSVAGAAVDAALAELGADLPLDPLIRAALQRC